MMTTFWRIVGALAVFLAVSLPLSVSAQEASPGSVLVLKVDGVINPASAEYIVKGIEEAERQEASLIVLRLDTPGGLDTSMRIIIKEMIGSSVPIAVYVSPSGSRAASAGTFITIAAHVAAMAPGTNIGAAHPVSIGGQQMDSETVKKVENDAAAYIRSLADQRGRNADWAEDAVRNSVSISDSVALDKQVIDLVAADLPALLLAVDGLRVETEAGERVIQTRGAEVVQYQMGYRQQVLNILSNPNISYMLLLLGMYGIFFELANPGAIFPGVAGGISILLGLYALQVLPVNYAGLGLILLGIIMFLLEIKVTSFGALSIGGAISMILGSVLLFDSSAPYLRISLLVIIPAVLTTAAFFLFLVGLGLKAQRKRSVSGVEGLIDMIGMARGPINSSGKVFMHGELWDAHSKEHIVEGEQVRVVGVEGLKLEVVKEGSP